MRCTACVQLSYEVNSMRTIDFWDIEKTPSLQQVLSYKACSMRMLLVLAFSYEVNNMNIYPLKTLNWNTFLEFYLVLMKYFLLVPSMGPFCEASTGNFRTFLLVKQYEDPDDETCYMNFFFQTCISKAYRTVLTRHLIWGPSSIQHEDWGQLLWGM